MITITEEWLEKRNACYTSTQHVINNGYIGLDFTSFLEKLIKNKRFDDAGWLMINVMNKRQSLQLALFLCELVLPVYLRHVKKQSKALTDAIETIKKYLKRPCMRIKMQSRKISEKVFDHAETLYEEESYNKKNKGYHIEAINTIGECVDAVSYDLDFCQTSMYGAVNCAIDTYRWKKFSITKTIANKAIEIVEKKHCYC